MLISSAGQIQLVESGDAVDRDELGQMKWERKKAGDDRWPGIVTVGSNNNNQMLAAGELDPSNWNRSGN